LRVDVVLDGLARSAWQERGGPDRPRCYGDDVRVPVAVAVAVTLFGAHAAGCGAAAVDAGAASTAARALRGGAPVAADDALARLALGRVVDAAGGLRCTAVAIAPRHVLTARHCLLPDGDLAGLVDAHTLGFLERGSDAALAVVAVVRHPDLDLAVLGLATPVRGTPVVELAGPATGDVVRVVGAGIGTPTHDVVHAGVFVVDAVDDTELTVLAAADAGLCPGDSGGPVLDLRGATPALLGVHVRGFADCDGPSTAVRVDAAAGFLASARAATVDDAEACAVADAAVADAADHCRGDALWRCVQPAWRVIPCAAVGHACLEDDGGARCVPVPCGDVSAAGRCEDGVALACIAGALVRADCADEEGRGCALDPTTGRRGCVPCDACGGVCVDHAVDVHHCGACGHACAGAERCADGVCVAVDAGAVDKDDDADDADDAHDAGDAEAGVDAAAGTGSGPGCAGSGAWMLLPCALRRRRRRS
jgi:hypothetical protein